MQAFRGGHGSMYTGFNLKKAKKQSRIEKLELEVKRLQQLLGTMIHLHEKLKSEQKEPTLEKNNPI